MCGNEKEMGLGVSVFSDGVSAEGEVGDGALVGSADSAVEAGVSVESSSSEVEPAVEPDFESRSQEEPTEAMMTRATYLRSLLLMHGVPFPMVEEALATTALARPEWDLRSKERRPVSYWQETIGGIADAR